WRQLARARVAPSADHVRTCRACSLTMARIRVRLPTQLRDLAAGDSSVDVVVDSTPVTVSSVLDSLAVTHPALERRVRDEMGRTRVHVNLFVDADNIRD